LLLHHPPLRHSGAPVEDHEPGTHMPETLCSSENSPDSGDFQTRIAPQTSSGNGKSPSPQTGLIEAAG
jgi:hypothetical protein